MRVLREASTHAACEIMANDERNAVFSIVYSGAAACVVRRGAQRSVKCHGVSGGWK